MAAITKKPVDIELACALLLLDAYVNQRSVDVNSACCAIRHLPSDHWEGMRAIRNGDDKNVKTFFDRLPSGVPLTREGLAFLSEIVVEALDKRGPVTQLREDLHIKTGNCLTLARSFVGRNI